MPTTSAPKRPLCVTIINTTTTLLTTLISPPLKALIILLLHLLSLPTSLLTLTDLILKWSICIPVFTVLLVGTTLATFPVWLWINWFVAEMPIRQAVRETVRESLRNAEYAIRWSYLPGSLGEEGTSWLWVD